jgi:hypothetical protein
MLDKEQYKEVTGMLDSRKSSLAEEGRENTVGVCWQTYLVALLIIIVGAVVIIPGALHDSRMQRFLGVSIPSLAGILVLVIVSLCATYAKGLRMEPAQRIALYSMVSLGFLLLGLPMVIHVMITVASLGAQATVNTQIELYFEKISSLVVVKDFDALMGFWQSAEVIPWGRWIGPLTTWTVFLLVFSFVVVAMLTLVRRHWIELERLSFPLNSPILALAGDKMLTVGDEHKQGYVIWTDPLVWLGLVYPFAFHLLGTLNTFYPVVPVIPTELNLHRTLPFGPAFATALSQEPEFSLWLLPTFMGIGYIAPLGISFSVWVFFIIVQLQKLVILAVGLWGVQQLPEGLTKLQSIFAPATYGVMTLWLARHELRRIFGEVSRKHKLTSDEPMSYRMALVGLAAGLVFLVGFCRILLHIPVMASIFYFVILLLVVMAYARMRAEVGYPGGYMAPFLFGISHWVTGKEFLGGSSRFGMSHFFNLEWSSMATHAGLAIESFQLADKTGLKKSSLIRAFLVVFVVVAVVGFAVALPVAYDSGMFSLNQGYVHLTYKAPFDVPFNYAGIACQFAPLYALYSALITLVLTLLNARFFWWPLHPVGFVIMGVAGIHHLWGGFAIGWFVKSLLLRYGGLSTMKRGMAFFMAMIIGDALFGGVSLILETIILSF